ncbi:MAG: type I-E CRISPR-associated protein Cas6/Cse3/CasE [Aerococcus sp.]|nr:type I-E CRISPR-associated protein Cas6/Cse3/CasE [Aerococcus sp.]
MYMTKLSLDVNSRATVSYLANLERIHGMIESAFPGGRKRRLWRVDTWNNQPFVLVVSEDKPDFSNNSHHAPIQEWETRDYAPLLEKLEAGQQWRFRLCANPTHAVSPGKGKRGKVYAHVTTEQQQQWLYERQEQMGIRLDPEGFRVVGSQWKNFNKGKSRRHTVHVKTAVYEGVLTITDPERFREILTTGVGRAKAYGCGLLTIAHM